MCHDEIPRPVRGGESITESAVQVPLANGELPANLFQPANGPAPAVLLFHDIHGVNPFYEDVCRRLALAGYLTLLPDFFFRQGPTDDSRGANSARKNAMEQSEMLEDIQSALIWLNHYEAATGKIGMIGFCMGGTAVMLAASREPTLQSAVAFYGFPAQARTPTAPLRPVDEDEAANLRAPLLALVGEEDKGVGMDNMDEYDALLTRYGRAHEFVRYPDIGHAFLTFEPDKPTFSQSQDAWNRTLKEFATRLGGPEPA